MDFKWMASLPISIRLNAAEAIIAKAPPSIPGQGGDRAVCAVACNLTIGCGLPAADAFPMLQQYNKSCLPAWPLEDLERKLDDALKLLPHAGPEMLGAGLVDFAVEVLDSLDLDVAAADGDVVLRRGQREERFKPATKPKMLEVQFERGLKRLFSELPGKLVKEAAKTRASEPLPPEQPVQPMDVFTVAAAELASMPADVVEEANAALRAPNLLDLMVKHVDALGFHTAGNELLVKAVLLGQAMRLTSNCSMVTVRGGYGSGKSQLINCACATLPPEFVVSITRLSPKALARRDQFDLQYKVVRGGERPRDDGDGNGEATAFIRQFISDGYLVHEVAGNDRNPSKCLRLRVDGPTSFLESTTSSNIFAEDESRMVSVWLNPSFSGQQSVLRSILARSQGGAASEVTATRFKLVSWAMHRQLKTRKVLLPKDESASSLMSFVDGYASDAARQLNKAIGMVSAHAVLHQFQRESDADGNLLATTTDIEAVKVILQALADAEPLAVQRADTFHATQAHAAFGDESFEASQLAAVCEVDVRTAGRWLKKWQRSGYVECIEQPAGSAPGKYRITNVAVEAIGGAVAA